MHNCCFCFSHSWSCLSKMMTRKVCNLVSQIRPSCPPLRLRVITRDHKVIDDFCILNRNTSSRFSSSRWKVSAKIQQLLNTLKKPKRRPLPEFYEDDDKELELAALSKVGSGYSLYSWSCYFPNLQLDPLILTPVLAGP